MAREHSDLFEQYAEDYGEQVKAGIARGKQVRKRSWRATVDCSLNCGMIWRLL
ncbi:hypothetical protein D3C73_1612970 [compost metagenome]